MDMRVGEKCQIFIHAQGENNKQPACDSSCHPLHFKKKIVLGMG